MTEQRSVLLIYTGGTIGMVPKDRNDPSSPLVPTKWDDLQDFVSSLKKLPFEVDLKQMTPIDSSDMHPDYWIEIARVIRDNYDRHDGFVILHGTDTMAYTASGLSFLLKNLKKPVVMTGSQLPIECCRNGGMQNLVSALTLASPQASDLPVIPEVCILFGDVVLRGNRARKTNATSFSAFASPNYPPLARVDSHIRIDVSRIRQSTLGELLVHERLDHNVLLVDIFPGMSPETLKYIFSTPGLKGVVLRTYGVGNCPTEVNFLKEIRSAVEEKQIIIVNLTQCVQGTVEMGRYGAGIGLLAAGVISGVDMTPEAALAKMMFLLGQGYDIETVKDKMQKDLRGELTASASVAGG